MEMDHPHSLKCTKLLHISCREPEIQQDNLQVKHIENKDLLSSLVAQQASTSYRSLVNGIVMLHQAFNYASTKLTPECQLGTVKIQKHC